MSSLFAVVRENHPPTGARCCVSGYFCSPTDLTIVVVSGSSLEIFAACEPAETSQGWSHGGHEPPGSSTKASLHSLLRYDLCGIVESMAMVRFPGKDRDQLLLVFRQS
jgi:hypothetical protein